MERPLLDVRFYETYSFAFAIRNILHDQLAYIRHLDEFYGDDKYLAFTKPFPKYSALHCFLEFVIDSIISSDNEDVDLEKRKGLIRSWKGFSSAIADFDPMTLPIEEAMKYHNLEYESFVEWLSSRGKSFLEAEEDE